MDLSILEIEIKQFSDEMKQYIDLHNPITRK